MDLLDQLAEPAVDLLDKVDRVLAAGAPEGHRIWPLLRRLRVLPGDALHEVLALRPEPLAGTGDATRTLLGAYDGVWEALAGGGSWQGPAAEAFDAHREALRAYLVDGAASLAGRLDTTASYAEAVADWIVGTRSALARTLADALGSAEAVAVVTAAVGADAVPDRMTGQRHQLALDTRPAARVGPAAAEIGARVLATVADAYDRAEALPGRWAPELLEVGYRPPDGPTVRPDGGRIVR